MNISTNFPGGRFVANTIMVLAFLMAALGTPTPVSAAAASNDDFDHPIAISTTNATLTMSEATFNLANDGLDDPNVCDFGNPGVHTVWYSFVPTTNAKVTISTVGSGFDTILALWTGTRNNLQSVACEDDDPVTGSLQADLTNISLQAYKKYYIEVVQYTSGSGPQKASAAPEDGVAPSASSASWLVLTLRYSGAAKVLTPGKYDDKSTLLSYTGTWETIANSSAYMRSFKKSKTVNNAVNFVIKGNQFNVIYSQNSGFGNLGVFVDGVQVDTISQYSATALHQQVATISGLTDDLHVVRLKHLSKNVSFDGVEVFAPPDLIPPSDILDLSAVAGPSFGSATLTWTVPGNDGLDGVAQSYDVRYSTAPIDASNWDAATKVATGVPAPGIPGSVQFMNVTGLNPEQTYFFAIQTLDEPAPDATPSGVSNSPSALTSTLGPFGAGTYDDKDLTKWMYIGVWKAVASTSARAGVYHVSSTIGNSAFFKFTGSKFTVIYSSNSAGGVIDVLVDGVSVGQINQKSSTQKWKLQANFPVLAGTHMIQFVHLSGAKVYLDGIIIQ